MGQQTSKEDEPAVDKASTTETEQDLPTDRSPSAERPAGASSESHADVDGELNDTTRTGPLVGTTAAQGTRDMLPVSSKGSASGNRKLRDEQSMRLIILLHSLSKADTAVPRVT